MGQMRWSEVVAMLTTVAQEHDGSTTFDSESVTISQPDGSTIKVTEAGDEGVMIEADGFWLVASRDEDTHVQPHARCVVQCLMMGRRQLDT